MESFTFIGLLKTEINYYKMYNNSCTMSDPSEEKWKLELVMFIVNTVSKKKNYKQELTSAKAFVLHSEKLSINLLVIFSAVVLTCYPPIFYPML